MPQRFRFAETFEGMFRCLLDEPPDTSIDQWFVALPAAEVVHRLPVEKDMARH
jgi:hypothetical protein